MKTLTEINHIIKTASFHRNRLEVLAAELAMLHDYQPGSANGRDLQAVVIDGMAYEEAMKRIMNRKLSEFSQDVFEPEPSEEVK